MSWQEESCNHDYSMHDGMQDRIVPYYLFGHPNKLRLTKQDSSVLIDKLEGRLDGWKAKHLSLGF